jgi:hypothetical protein
MTSVDYNGQQVPKRIKMLIAADRLVAALQQFMSPELLAVLTGMLDYAEVRQGDRRRLRPAPGGGEAGEGEQLDAAAAHGEGEVGEELLCQLGAGDVHGASLRMAS